ncbi:hypothetical protein J8L84_09630 [Alteromonas sp. MMG017]|uniref:sulfotransferase family protein n=1 Tax=Alteromonas sp. MMG017 TaxID=2822692 RepID=UPI001B3A3258|nr:hypothetical protein [Alteromonas sp. MMG017]MBQ4829542.1 hypothetical protein [Alteromonas sp. MMG017]
MRQKAILVIGMHRSGTSAVSGLLAEMGVFMGKTLFAAQKGVNEKGFYENSELVGLNEQILDRLLWSWDDPLAACIDKHLPELDNAIENKGRRIIANDYENQSAWGMKDPRTTLLLPFWQKVIDQSDIEATYVLMIRSPFEVYASLKKRDGFSLEKSLMLWINYTLSGYFNSVDKNLFVLAYERLLSNPQVVAKELAMVASLDVEFDPDSLNFIDKNLKNQANINTPKTPLTSIALKLFDAFTEPTVNHAKVVETATEYSKYKKSLSPVLIEHLISLKKEEVHFRHLFMKAYQSYWWKISWPVKMFEQWLSKDK